MKMSRNGKLPANDQAPNMVRCNLYLRSDVRDAMEVLRRRWHKTEGAYVTLGRIFGEAAMLLLRREGMPLEDDPTVRKTGLPAGRPPRSVERRRLEA
jgi:hypothetical protein